MRFTGLLLKESLQDERVLDLIEVIKTETWHIDNTADFQPNIWTALTFEGDENQADTIAEKMSQSLKPRWYINISTEKHAYVIFLGKVFKYPKGDQLKRAEAENYARSLGIPESQIDWDE
jgi:hypothetical protein